MSEHKLREVNEANVGEHGVLPKLRHLPHNPLDGFNNGASLDLRVRFAMQLLTSPMFERAYVDGGEIDIAVDASMVALDVATALFAEADKRGLIEALVPIDQDQNLQEHIHRQAKFSAQMQFEGGKAMKDLQDGALHLASAVRSTLKTN